MEGRVNSNPQTDIGQFQIVNGSLYIPSIPLGSIDDYYLVINPNSKQVKYIPAFENNFTGSLFGTASFSISASQALTASYIDASNVIGLNLSRISTGSITASVNIGADTFKIQSGSSTFFTVNSNGNTTINNSLYIIQKASIGTAHQSASLTISASSAEDAVLVKINDNNVADKFKINNEGVMVLGSLDNTPTAIEGGIFYSSSNDYFLGFI
jgi:hypothetical protein